MTVVMTRGMRTIAALLAATALAAPAVAADITGAGATFPAPLYAKWGSAYKAATKNQLNYQAIGSGAGQAQIKARTVDFGASDDAMKAEDLSSNGLVQFPAVIGSEVIIVNLPGVAANQLRLTPDIIAAIYQGKITKWNDPAIVAFNKGVPLRPMPITPVYRSDSSGTTAGFTTFLADDSPVWAKQVGSDKTVKWPVGTGAAKNAGVAAAVKQTQGSIGYVEQAYALENGFTYASIKNAAGNYETPTIANTSAAAVGIKIPADLGISTINSTGKDAYPIVSQTFLDAYKDPCTSGKASSAIASGLKKFLTYAIGDGQQTLGSGGSKLPYAPLPAGLVAKDKTELQTMTCNGSPIS